MPDNDWAWAVANALLDAAIGCGAKCERRFVSTDPTPEGPPPGCACQLVAALVRDGYRADKGSPARYRQIEVVLTLHQCTPVPTADATVDPALESTTARHQATTRDLMIRGIRQAFKAHGGPLGLCQSHTITEGWTHIATTGGMSKWTMSLTVE